MDTDYYFKLYEDLSTPFYNKATQQLTAPGSTVQMIRCCATIQIPSIAAPSISR